jgi:hypothetical protein
VRWIVRPLSDFRRLAERPGTRTDVSPIGQTTTSRAHGPAGLERLPGTGQSAKTLTTVLYR